MNSDLIPFLAGVAFLILLSSIFSLDRDGNEITLEKVSDQA